MAFREIKPDPLVGLYSDDAPKTSAVSTISRKFKIPSLDLDNKANLQVVTFLMFRIVIVVALVWFGLSASGSNFGPAAGKFKGDLAIVFYQWGIGYLLAMVGVVVGYDTVKRFI